MKIIYNVEEAKDYVLETEGKTIIYIIAECNSEYLYIYIKYAIGLLILYVY